MSIWHKKTLFLNRVYLDIPTRENEARKIHIGCPEGPSWGCGTNLQKGKAADGCNNWTNKIWFSEKPLLGNLGVETNLKKITAKYWLVATE